MRPRLTACPPPLLPRWTCGLLWLCLGLSLLPATARADILPPGQRSVPRESLLDFGPFAEHSVRLYKVQKGDTLSQIAERELGTVKRQGEVTALNPGLDPAQIRTGSTLLLPARVRVEPKAGQEPPVLWHFFAALWGGRAGFERIQHGQALPAHHYSVTVYAVHGARVAELERIAAEPPKDLDKALAALVARPGAARSADLPGNRAFVSDASPVERELRRLRISAIAEGRVSVEEQAVEQYDRNERLVSSGLPLGAWLGGLLLLLAGGGLWWHRRQGARAGAGALAGQDGAADAASPLAAPRAGP